MSDDRGVRSGARGSGWGDGVKKAWTRRDNGQKRNKIKTPPVEKRKKSQSQKQTLHTQKCNIQTIFKQQIQVMSEHGNARGGLVARTPTAMLGDFLGSSTTYTTGLVMLSVRPAAPAVRVHAPELVRDGVIGGAIEREEVWVPMETLLMEQGVQVSLPEVVA